MNKNVSDEDSESDSDSDPKGPVPTASRRSASMIILELAKPTRYRQILYVPCYQLADTNKS